MKFLTLKLRGASPSTPRLVELLRRLVNREEHHGCCFCALCGVVDLAKCEPVGIDVWWLQEQLLATNFCPTCAAEVEAAARVDANAWIGASRDA